MTPRPKKPRKCACPYRARFEQVYKPAGIPLSELEVLYLDHDELEALFLCDSENLSQEQAGEKMGISRGTVQRLVARGRKKVVEALVKNKALAIGDVSAALQPGRESGEVTP